MSEYCQFTNICDDLGNMMACQKDPSLLPPLPLAEDLCIDALNACFEVKLKEFNPSDESPEAAKLILRLGDIRLEQGLSPNVDPTTASAYLDESMQYFQFAQAHPNQAPPICKKVENLITYMPAFKSRRNIIDHRKYGKELGMSPEDHLPQIQREIAARAFDLESVEPKGRLGILSISGVSLLLARKGRLDYPTTKRERGSADESPALKLQSHTTYSIIDGYKLPTRCRYRDPDIDSAPDFRRASVSLSHLVARHATYTDRDILKQNPGVYTGIVMRLLVNEVLGRPLRANSFALLNSLSDDLVARQDNLLQSIKNQGK